MASRILTQKEFLEVFVGIKHNVATETGKQSSLTEVDIIVLSRLLARLGLIRINNISIID